MSELIGMQLIGCSRARIQDRGHHLSRRHCIGVAGIGRNRTARHARKCIESKSGAAVWMPTSAGLLLPSKLPAQTAST